jgi:hypothetical protein
MSKKVFNYVDADQMKIDIGYTLADLSTGMMDQASLFVHYGVLAAKASKQVDDFKMLLEVAESKVYRKLRDQAVTDGVKLTEAQLEKSVSVHEQVIAMKRALNEGKQIEAIAKTAAEGFRHRRDMLVQAGMLSREELKGEVSINRRAAVAEGQNSQKERVLENIRRSKEEKVSA